MNFTATKLFVGNNTGFVGKCKILIRFLNSHVNSTFLAVTHYHSSDWPMELIADCPNSCGCKLSIKQDHYIYNGCGREEGWHKT